MRSAGYQTETVLHSRLRQASWLALLLAIWGGIPSSLWACAVCYGDVDSPMARGLNWGIFTLLVVVVTVLASITAFFVMTARRSAALESTGASTNQPAMPLAGH